MTRDLREFTYPEEKSFLFKLKVGSWFIVARTLFERSFCPSFFKVVLLRIWGAQVGRSVLLKRNIRVSFPWQLEIGSNCWIGESVSIINHAKVTIEEHVCVSQRSIICSSGHNYRSISLEYLHKPIVIKRGAWICLNTIVLAGVTIGECSVISAGEIARSSVPDYSMLIYGQVNQIETPK